MRLIDADSSRDEFENDIELDSYFACKTIDKWPTIDAAPVVHAYWDCEGYSKQCTNCYSVIGFMEPCYNYCPHCGAKMDVMED